MYCQFRLVFNQKFKESRFIHCIYFLNLFFLVVAVFLGVASPGAFAEKWKNGVAGCYSGPPSCESPQADELGEYSRFHKNRNDLRIHYGGGGRFWSFFKGKTGQFTWRSVAS